MDPSLQLQLDEIEKQLGRKVVRTPGSTVNPADAIILQLSEDNKELKKKAEENETKLEERLKLMEERVKLMEDRDTKREEDHKGISTKLEEWTKKFSKEGE